MGFLAPTHIVLLLVVAVLLFGADRLPEMARALGKGVREFKESVSDATGLDVGSLNEMKQTLSPTNMVRSALPTEIREAMGEDVRQTELRAGRAARTTEPGAAPDFVPERHQHLVPPKSE